MMGASDLIELVKALTQRDEKDKPKTKEAEVIKLNNMPAPESYRNWKNHVRDEAKSCSDRSDEAWAWLNEVYDQSCTRDKLEEKFQDPGKFLTLDTKLSAALTRSAGRDLATRILNYKEQQSLGVDMFCSCLRTTSKHQKKQVASRELKICWVSPK